DDARSAAATTTSTEQSTRYREQPNARRFGHGRQEVVGVVSAELAEVVLNLAERRSTHAVERGVAAVQEAQRPAERAALRVERQVAQHVVVEVDLTVVIKVAVEPARQVVIEAIVGADVIVEV